MTQSWKNAPCQKLLQLERRKVDVLVSQCSTFRRSRGSRFSHGAFFQLWVMYGTSTVPYMTQSWKTHPVKNYFSANVDIHILVWRCSTFRRSHRSSFWQGAFFQLWVMYVTSAAPYMIQSWKKTLSTTTSVRTSKSCYFSRAVFNFSTFTRKPFLTGCVFLQLWVMYRNKCWTVHDSKLEKRTLSKTIFRRSHGSRFDRVRFSNLESCMEPVLFHKCLKVGKTHPVKHNFNVNVKKLIF